MACLQFQRDSVHFDHEGEQTCQCTGRCAEVRVLYLTVNRKSTDCHTEGSLSRRDLKAHPHCDRLPPTKPYLLKCHSLWGHFLSNHQEYRVENTQLEPGCTSHGTPGRQREEDQEFKARLSYREKFEANLEDECVSAHSTEDQMSIRETAWQVSGMQKCLV